MKFRISSTRHPSQRRHPALPAGRTGAPRPSGRPEVYICALHARPRRAARARAPATWLPRPAFKSGWVLRYCCCMAPHNAPNCSASLLLTTIAQDHAL